MSGQGVERLLAARYGLDAELLGRAAVEAAVGRLAREAGQSPRDYVLSLEGSAEALQALVEAVTVHETWFARDDGPFEYLAQHLVQCLAERPAGRWAAVARLRVLCLACATGEEAWSLAMALREAGLGPHEFLVQAVDVSGTALARARAGVYPARAFRTPLALSWCERWCEPAAGGFRVREALRESVRFEQANLLDPRWADGLAPAQVVACRNVLIYFAREARERVMGLIERVLAPEGLVITGHAEAVLFAGRFAPLGPPRAFAFRRRPDRPARPEVTLALSAPPSSPRLPPPRAASLATPPAPPMAPSTAGELAQAQALADQGRYAEALARVERLLAGGRTDARAWLLKGLTEAALEQRQAAASSLGRVLYLEPGNEVALLALARLETLAGRGERARLLRERAARLGAQEAR